MSELQDKYVSEFQDQNVLVTGSTHGVGLAAAQLLADRGANLVLHGLPDSKTTPDPIASCQRESNRVSLVAMDLATDLPNSARDLVAQAWQQHGPIDHLVCNAGTYIDQPFLDMDFERFDRTMKLNVYAYFLVVQEVARRWVQTGHRGNIVLVGSINGRLGEDVHVAYDTSKGAVEMMVKSLAISLGRHGIRVNGMAPGLVTTPLTQPALDDSRFRRWMELHTPNGQVPGPEACAGTIAFLLGQDAPHMNGQMLLVDGGMSAWQQPDPPDEYR